MNGKYNISKENIWYRKIHKTEKDANKRTDDDFFFRSCQLTQPNPPDILLLDETLLHLEQEVQHYGPYQYWHESHGSVWFSTTMEKTKRAMTIPESETKPPLVEEWL